jgi:putative intracellular protease/amidase
MKEHDTGLWIEELASPYYIFKEAGYEIVIASPAGGPVPIDAGSMADGFFSDEAKKFMHDAAAVGQLSHSIKLDTLNFPGDFDAIYLPGGHGCCTDFIGNPALKSAIETMYRAGKFVTTVCHGPICLTECTKEDGTPFVQGKTVTGFTDSEEAAVGYTEVVPVLIETKFKEQGANFEKGDDWTSKVCIDGNLITGQNPQSSVGAATALVKALA